MKTSIKTTIILFAAVVFCPLVTRAVTIVTQVAVGTSHALFLKSDGSLWGMGDNTSGELGLGTTTSTNKPVLIMGSNVVACAASQNFSFFIKADGTLWGMGANSHGQLGDNTTTQRISPVMITNNVTAVVAGLAHTLFLKGCFIFWSDRRTDPALQSFGKVNRTAQRAVPGYK
jgi:alpha-tubulin suppressor-like RCC1 family protein